MLELLKTTAQTLYHHAKGNCYIRSLLQVIDYKTALTIESSSTHIAQKHHT